MSIRTISFDDLYNFRNDSLTKAPVLESQTYDAPGAFVPEIDRVLFNLKTTDVVKDANGTKTTVTLDNPILTTIVYFADKTKVVVKNSAHDKVKLIAKKLDNGKEVYVADDASKELGIIYAIAKRLIGIPDAKGTVKGEGFGRILKEIIDEGYDTTYENAVNDAQKAANKAKVDKLVKVPKAPRPSLAQSVDRLTEILSALEAKLS